MHRIRSLARLAPAGLLALLVACSEPVIGSWHGTCAEQGGEGAEATFGFGADGVLTIRGAWGEYRGRYQQRGERLTLPDWGETTYETTEDVMALSYAADYRGNGPGTCELTRRRLELHREF